MKKIIPIFVIALFLVGSASFYGGMKYQQGKNSSFGAGDFSNLTQEQRQQRFAQMGGQNGQKSGVNRTGGMSGATIGEIISQDEKSLTIKLRDGGSKIVFFSQAVKITKTDAGSLTDLKVGENIVVSGSTNSDGSVTAENIQLANNVFPNQATGAPSSEQGALKK